MSEPQKVKVYVKISGDCCAFYEISFSVVFDLTNNKLLRGPSFDLDDYDEDEDKSDADSYGYKEGYKEAVKKYLENYEYEGGNYSDYETREAILFKGKYYVEW